jgi:hypothetical protein
VWYCTDKGWVCVLHQPFLVFEIMLAYAIMNADFLPQFSFVRHQVKRKRAASLGKIAYDN